ncbi:MAG: hypothetical protein LH473_03865, partial [Chitinophagales bacterium]|nr:hypothetical protein [Chitinophagales bacterium]
ASGAAYQTADGGHTWNILVMPGKTGASLYFQDKATGFISGYQAIYKTTDGGITWETIAIDKIYYHDYFFISATNGVAVANDHDQNRAIWITTDGGSNWKNVFNEANYYIHSVWFTTESTGWAAGYYDLDGVNHEPVILESTDGGLTWKDIYHNTDVSGEGEELLDIRFKNEKEGFAISNLADDVFTTDGGLNWTRTYDSKTFGLPEYGGIYSTLGGLNEMYITGSEGYLVKWK